MFNRKNKVDDGLWDASKSFNQALEKDRLSRGETSIEQSGNWWSRAQFLKKNRVQIAGLGLSLMTVAAGVWASRGQESQDNEAKKEEENSPSPENSSSSDKDRAA